MYQLTPSPLKMDEIEDIGYGSERETSELP